MGGEKWGVAWGVEGATQGGAASVTCAREPTVQQSAGIVMK